MTVAGKTLTIYLSAPSGSDEPQLTQDVLKAEELAFNQLHGEVSGFTLQMRTVSSAKPSDNARVAIKDTTTIAYLGEVVPHSSYASLGITNALDLLQVSPTDNALELTQPTPAVRGSPGRYYEALKTYGRTFARMVPSSAVEAKAQLQQMRSLGVKRVYVLNDGGAYGAAISRALSQDASGAGVTPVQGSGDPAKLKASGADAVFLGASSPAAAARLLNSLSAAAPKLKLFVPSALDNSAFAGSLSPASQAQTQISSPGLLPGALNAKGKRFVSSFVANYHHQPALQAVFGFEAMAAVLSVLRQAGSSATNRNEVVKDFLKLNRSAADSAIGQYTINGSGDTSSSAFVFSRVQAGRPVPYKSVQVQG